LKSGSLPNDPMPTVRTQLQGHLVNGSLIGRTVASVVSLSFLSLTVLCAERIGQMTKTYNDIDAVTRLLEEVSVWGSKSCSQFILTSAHLTVCFRGISETGSSRGII
jgi:hypothetical protein